MLDYRSVGEKDRANKHLWNCETLCHPLHLRFKRIKLSYFISKQIPGPKEKQFRLKRLVRKKKNVYEVSSKFVICPNNHRQFVVCPLSFCRVWQSKVLNIPHICRLPKLFLLVFFLNSTSHPFLQSPFCFRTVGLSLGTIISPTIRATTVLPVPGFPKKPRAKRWWIREAKGARHIFKMLGRCGNLWSEIKSVGS